MCETAKVEKTVAPEVAVAAAVDVQSEKCRGVAPSSCGISQVTRGLPPADIGWISTLYSKGQLEHGVR
jgi:hypothetical protein